MKDKKKPGINETLNDILLQIFSGIDYATKIALKTNKSIPVVYRQLDALVEFGILKKQRAGKKVAYEVDWINFSDMVSSTLFMDIERLRTITKAHEKETKIVSELKLLIEEVPKDLFTNRNALKAMIKGLFSQKEIVQLIEEFYKEIDMVRVEHVDFNKLSFEETINLFIDTFGMLDKKQQRKLLSKKMNMNNEDVKNFLRYCRIKYLQKQLYDPRNKFLRAIK